MMEQSTLADFIEELAEQDLGDDTAGAIQPIGEHPRSSRGTVTFGFKYESDTIIIYAGQAGA